MPIFFMAIIVCVIWLFILSIKIKSPKKIPGNKYFAPIFFLILLLGILRFGAYANNNANITKFIGKGTIIVLGIVSSEPQTTDSVKKAVITVEQLVNGASNKQDLSGNILLSADRFENLKFGDKIELSASLKDPATIGGQDYKNYLSSQGIFALASFGKIKVLKNQANPFLAFIYAVKNKLNNSASRVLPEPQNAFLSGLILGGRQSMSKQLQDDFKTTGMSHLVAMSGYNISIVAWMISAILLMIGFGRKNAFYLSVFFIIIFIIMVGFSASVVRAGVMGILLLTAQRYGRLSKAGIAIILAGAIMLAQNPALLRFDVGFQLSFVATLGMVYLSPMVESIFIKKMPKVLSTIISTTLSAQLVVTPLLLYHFGRLSVVSPIVNLLILPIVPLIMLVGFTMTILSLIWIPLAKIVGILAYILLSYPLAIINYFANISFASIDLPKLNWFLIVAYYLVFGWLAYNWQRKKRLALLMPEVVD